jgi:hypothetical protein
LVPPTPTPSASTLPTTCCARGGRDKRSRAHLSSNPRDGQVAAAIAQLWPNAWTRWQRRNRRYLGATFAASHALHAIAIAAFAALDPPGFATATEAG